MIVSPVITNPVNHMHTCLWECDQKMDGLVNQSVLPDFSFVTLISVEFRIALALRLANPK